MGKLPKAIIKKYGISKKAWAVYRGRKKKSRSSSSRKITKKRTVRYMAKKKTRKKGKSATMQLFWMGVGAGAKGTVSGFVNTYIPQVPENVGTAAVGYALYKYTKGVPSQIGKGVLIASIGGFVADWLPGILKGSGGVKTIQPVGTGW